MVAEIINVSAICLAFMTIGLNIAFIVTVKRYSVFPLPTVLFLVGKSLLNLYIIFSLWSFIHDFSWRGPLALINYAVVASSMAYLYLRTTRTELHVPGIVVDHPEAVEEAGILQQEWNGEERRECD